MRGGQLSLLYSQIVSNRLLKLAGWVLHASWPPIPCPDCGEGIIRPAGDLMKLHDPASEQLLAHITAGMAGTGELTGTCSGTFRCSDPECGRAVLISGDWSYDVDVDTLTNGTRWTDFIRVRYVSPALPIFTPPAKTPEKVTAAIHAASELLWINPNAAANQLRQAIEELLTSKRVRRTEITRKKKRRRLSAHDRIELYRAADPANADIADTLEAVKWIGNSGSHEATLTIAEVLEGAELLEHALKELYDPTGSLRRARIKQINKGKGIPRTKQK